MLFTALTAMAPLIVYGQSAATGKIITEGTELLKDIARDPKDAADLAISAAQGNAQERTMRQWIEITIGQFTEKMRALSNEMSTVENIYSGIKTGTDIASQVYSGAQFIAAAQGTISDLYSLYGRTKNNYTAMMQAYGELVASGHMSPSEYTAISARLLGEITEMQKDLLDFIDIFLDPQMRSLSFNERWQRLNEILTKWKTKTDEELRAEEEAKRKALEEEAELRRKREALRSWYAALQAGRKSNDGVAEQTDTTGYTISPFIEDKEAMKKKLRSVLSPFSVKNIYGIVFSLIIIISAILVPMALWLYFKGDGERHKDAPLKLIVGFLVSVMIMGILWMIFGNASLNF